MKFIVDFLINGPERLSAWFAWLPPLFARIVVGWVFLWSGWGKLNALDRITQNFVEWGIPFPHIMTPFVSGVEFFGGLLLLLGLFTRVAAVPLVVTMIVAILSAKLGDVDSLETLLGFEEVCLHGAVRLACRGRARADLARLAVAALARRSRPSFEALVSRKKRAPRFARGPRLGEEAWGGSNSNSGESVWERDPSCSRWGDIATCAPARLFRPEQDEEKSKPLIIFLRS